jgi:hypothetical protein
MSPKLFVFREAGMQVSPATMSCPSPRASAPPCLPLGIRGLLKEDIKPLLEAFAFCFGLLALAFLCGRLLEGKRLLKGKDC